LYRAEIHHRSWRLQAAEAEIDLNTMPPEGLTLPEDPLFHYSQRRDAVIWPLRPA
jgi:Uncharacterized conserved protein (COG2071)